MIPVVFVSPFLPFNGSRGCLTPPVWVKPHGGVTRHPCLVPEGTATFTDMGMGWGWGKTHPMEPKKLMVSFVDVLFLDSVCSWVYLFVPFWAELWPKRTSALQNNVLEHHRLNKDQKSWNVKGANVPTQLFNMFVNEAWEKILAFDANKLYFPDSGDINTCKSPILVQR